MTGAEEKTMKLKVPSETTVEPKFIRVAVAVNYDEEDMPNDFPGRTGDVWEAVVDIDSGVIRDWPEGHAAEFYMKVTDQGDYHLLDAAESVLAKIESDYVPACIPEQYGDYLDFKIGPDGAVDRWREFCTPDRVRKAFWRE